MALLDAVTTLPVIGHVRGLVHLAYGEEEEAKEVLIKANRKTCVVVAGTVGGATGGPGGAILASTYAGACYDTAHSIASKKPRGLVKNIDDMCTDIRNDRIPIRSSIETALTVGEDALAGYGCSKSRLARSGLGQSRIIRI